MKKILLFTFFICTPMLAVGESVSDEYIMKLVEKVLAQKPELVKAALIAQRTKEQEEVKKQQNSVIKEHRSALFNGKYDYRAGNPKGDVSILMLHDFRCGHCKTAHQRINAYLQDEKNVNVVFKDFPILGPDSKFAARATLAAYLQGKGKQKALVHKITNTAGQVDDDDVLRLAKDAGLDIKRLEKDMDSKQVWRELGNTKAAARRLGVRSTPTFIISAKGKEQVITGVLEKSDLMDIVEKARKA